MPLCSYETCYASLWNQTIIFSWKIDNCNGIGEIQVASDAFCANSLVTEKVFFLLIQTFSSVLMSVNWCFSSMFHDLGMIFRVWPLSKPFTMFALLSILQWGKVFSIYSMWIILNQFRPIYEDLNLKISSWPQARFKKKTTSNIDNIKTSFITATNI